ncbi:MAG: OmpA family protein [Kiritimatiellae bacterium]|nr:OmpA family protein [Kiritimatiellia bacterium]
MLTDTGCRTKAGGWRWPWSKDRSEVLSNGTELTDPLSVQSTDVPNVFDPAGNLVSGARFEDSLQPVQGITFAPVYFGFDSYSLPPQEMSKIDLVAQDLLQNNQHVVVVEGHCDERGSNEYNLSLGENRAQAIRARLVALGVAADRIQTRSYGEEKPAAMGTGEQVWRLNRRGEFALYQQ